MILSQAEGPPSGLSGGAHLMVAISVLGVIIFAIVLLRRRRLQSKYALLWLVAVLPLGILAIFPDLLDSFAELVGVNYPPALFLFLAVVALFLIVMQYSWDLSKLYEQSRVLAEEIALLSQLIRSQQHRPGGDEPGSAD